MIYTIPVHNSKGIRTRTIMARKGRPKKQKPVSLPHIAFDIVENPNYQKGHAESRTNPRFIEAQYNMKESPVSWLKAKGFLDAPQAMAGLEVRRLYEATGGSGIKAMDYTKEPVDGNWFSDGLTDKKQNAAKELAIVRNVLGNEGYDLTIKVCGECMWIKDIELTSWRQHKAGKNLKHCLSVLAVHWGYQSRGILSCVVKNGRAA